MERILSKEEIAELLAAVKHGEVGSEDSEDRSYRPGPHKEKEVLRVDLTRTQGSGTWRMPNLDILLDNFARHLSMSFTNRLQRYVAVKPSGSRSMEYEPFVQRLTPKGSIGIVGLDPLKAPGLIIFDDRLSFALVEILLGGSIEAKLLSPDRTLTAIEKNVVRGVINDCCDDLQKALQPLVEVQASLAQIETNPRLVSIVGPDAGIVVADFSVAVDSLSGNLSLVIPHASLEPLREKLRDRSMPLLRKETKWHSQVRTELHEMELECCARLASVSLRVRDILNLKEGDIIDLAMGPEDPVCLVLGDKPKFMAKVGIRNRKKAIKVRERIVDGTDKGSKHSGKPR